MLLVATVGGPYFVLASTGPLMQKWFSQTSPERSPYRLYAISQYWFVVGLAQLSDRLRTLVNVASAGCSVDSTVRHLCMLSGLVCHAGLEARNIDDQL